MKRKLYPIILSFCLFLPAVSSAANSNGVKDLLTSTGKIVGSILPVMAGLAVVYFFWGVGQFILHSGEEEARREGRLKIMWGIVAIAVIFSLAGVISLVGSLVVGTQQSNASGSGNGVSGGSTPCFVSGNVGDEGGPCTGN